MGTGETLKGILRRPLYARDAFEQNPSAWRASFRALVEEVISEIDAEAGHKPAD